MAQDPALDGRARLALVEESQDDYFDGPGEATCLEQPGEPGEAEPHDWTPGDDAGHGEPGAAATALFGPGGAAESMPPGTVLHMLVEQAVGNDLAEMTDDEVIGTLAAARRLRDRAEWLELRATREFARRRWEADRFPVRDEHGRWRLANSDAEHAADEIAFHLTDNRAQAEDGMELSLALRDRLPAMDALMATGRSDRRRCQAVCDITSGLSDDDARRVDEALAPDAAGLGYDALRRRAAKLAMSLDPESQREHRQSATRKKARVEKFMEASGNYAFAARELPIEEALASESYIRGLAAYLRANGVKAGQREAELMCYLDLTQGRDPRDRIERPRDSPVPGHGGTSASGGPDASQTPATPERGAGSPESGSGDGQPGNGDDGQPGDDAHDQPWSGKPSGRAPFPAMINLLVPVGTLLGWSAMPGEAGRDIIDPQTLRDLVQAASDHQATRWCVTVIGEDRTASAHGCARGQHTWTPPPARGRLPAHEQAAHLAELLSRLRITLEPIAKESNPKASIDRQHEEPGYRPSRKLQHLIRARDATCPAPGCGASSYYCDIDHTTAWPGGPTAEGNLGAPCRHHHRTKQAPGWTLQQPEPGAFRWTTPSGRVYETRPTRYDV